jgi:DNA polymerase-1
LETIDVKAGIRAKLEASKENAYLSKDLGRICLQAPVSTDLSDYEIKTPDSVKATNLLMSLEMSKLLGRLNLSQEEFAEQENAKEIKLFEITDAVKADAVIDITITNTSATNQSAVIINNNTRK